ncbi:primase homolog protein [Cajanus cajan]|uniref:primase homolog protein n=1 Tax=Cajanus cajan TaxID=3821 RepID=UPI00098DB813|nr:primase homolog protein [Cajanus cajan]
MSVFRNQWLCFPLTQALFSRLLPRTYASVLSTTRLCPVWCHSVPRSTCSPGCHFLAQCAQVTVEVGLGSVGVRPDLLYHRLRLPIFITCPMLINISIVKVVAYFRERLISEKTLSRNAVRQLCDNKTVIAFTYKQNGLLVGCKYRTMEKRFWQGKGTDKILYGIDDISHASEIIIVEGEIDKLSLEEAGFQNCVSVPVGAPRKVSSKDLPPIEKDTAYQYLWNCKEYLDKAVRIILATDNDPPGQALAEELARRLGRERCWRVLWPKKDEFSFFKDANEVLKHMGADALKKIVENAEPYTNDN